MKTLLLLTVSLFSVSFANAQNAGARATAISQILVKSADKNLANTVADEINAKSYLKATSEASQSTDAELILESSQDEVSWSLSSSLDQSKRQLAEGMVERTAKPQLQAAAIVTDVLRTIPYRGFVTRRLNEKTYEINLGSDHGIQPDQKLRIWEFEDSGPTFESKMSAVADVIVTETKAQSSVVEVDSDSDENLVFGKIGFVEMSRGMMSEPPPNRARLRVAAEQISFSGDSSDPLFADRVFSLSSAQGLALGLSWRKFSLQGLFAQGRATGYDLGYFEVRIKNQVWEKSLGWGHVSASIGLQASRFNQTSKSDAIRTAASDRYSPTLALDVDRTLRSGLGAFAGLEIDYPVLNNATSSFLFSYATAVRGGITYQVNPRLGIDVGARRRIGRMPVVEETAVQEHLTEVFAGLSLGL